MKKIISILVFSSSFFTLSQAQIISTIAGNGYNAGTSNGGYSGDGGAAILAEMSLPTDVKFDFEGNIYIADWANNAVREINTSTGNISTVAGNGTHHYTGDGGQATAAELAYVAGIALDSISNIYISDMGNNVIRKVTASTGIITTVAGNGYNAESTRGGYTGDGGQATSAELFAPQGLAFDDSGNLYFSDGGNCVIRKVIVSTGIITTVVGTGMQSYGGDGGPATAAELHGPVGITLDHTNNIYFADGRNCVIRKVTASSGIITTVAGNGIRGYVGDEGQATSAELSYTYGVALDTLGNIYLSEENDVIRKVIISSGVITTVAGNGIYGYSGDGGLARNAEFNQPAGITFDDLGNIYIADEGNNVIRKVVYDTTTGIVNLKTEIGGVSIFPNPNNGSFVLSLLSSNEKYSLEIYNILGAKIYTDDLSLEQNYYINLTGQPNGIYLYRVLKEGGELTGDGKIIIEK